MAKALREIKEMGTQGRDAPAHFGFYFYRQFPGRWPMQPKEAGTGATRIGKSGRSGGGYTRTSSHLEALGIGDGVLELLLQDFQRLVPW